MEINQLIQLGGKINNKKRALELIKCPTEKFPIPQWAKGDPLLPPLCSDQWITFVFLQRSLEAGRSGGLLVFECVDVSMERAHALPALPEQKPSPRASQHLEAHLPPAGNMEGRMVEGEVYDGCVSS